MRRFERILLATRARTRDAAAVRRAFALARKYGARLGLTDVVDSAVSPSGPQSGDLLRRLRLRRRRRELEDLFAAEPFGQRPTVSALTGDRAQGILQLLRNGEQDLAIIDLEHHGEIRMSAEDLEQLQSESPTPLLFIRGSEQTRARRVAVALDPTADDRAFARRLLQLGQAMAEERAAKLVVVSAWTPFGLGLLKRRNREAGETLVDRSRALVAERQRELVVEAGLDPTKMHFEILRGEAHEILPAYCSASRTDLLVIGHNGRQGVARAIFGNTADSVLKRAPVAILTVPTARFEVLKKRMRRRVAAFEGEPLESNRSTG